MRPRAHRKRAAELIAEAEQLEHKRNPSLRSLFTRPPRKEVTLDEVRGLQEEESESLCRHHDFTAAKRALKQSPKRYAKARGLRIEDTDRTSERDAMLKKLLKKKNPTISPRHASLIRKVEQAMKSGSDSRIAEALDAARSAGVKEFYLLHALASGLSLRPTQGGRNPNWIAGTIKRPGALHRTLGVPRGENIPPALIREAKSHPELYTVWYQKFRYTDHSDSPPRREIHIKASSAQEAYDKAYARCERLFGENAFGPNFRVQTSIRLPSGNYESAIHSELDRENPESDHWIAGTIKRPGALHRTLSVPQGRDIPVTLIREAKSHPERFVKGHAAQTRLERQANEALEFKSFRKKNPVHTFHDWIKQSPENLRWFLTHAKSLGLLVDGIAEGDQLEVLVQPKTGYFTNKQLEALGRAGFRSVGTDRASLFVRWSGERRNPEVEIAPAAEELYTSFHGREPHRIGIFDVPTSIAADLAELGILLKIKIIGRGRMLQQIKFTREEGVRLAADPGSQSLYIIGDKQRLPANCLDEMEREFGEAACKDQIILGTVKEITYEAKKGFDKFETIDYYHELGEETGERPLLVYDRRDHRLLIVGGAYTVKPEGITN